MPHENSCIIVENVNKSFAEIKAVSNLGFVVEPSMCFGLLGPNGAGKTTMMKMIYGHAKRDTNKESKISVFGYDPLYNELDIKFFSGVVPQDNNLDEDLNVLQNLIVFSKFYRLPSAQAKKRIDELLEFMELSEKKKALIRELSGGMKRRLIIARALLNNPRLLILDEPTTGLDPQVRHLIWDKVRSLKRQGITVLLTTHYMEEAFQICDRILIMDKGSKVMEGQPQQLMKQNIEPFVLEIMNHDHSSVHVPRDLIKQIRRDDTGDVLRFYAHSDESLRRIAQKLKAGDYYLRVSNLEDLFLKATGRALNVHQ
jgi:lipooligosaccharide transport system ATP-binding protein